MEEYIIFWGESQDGDRLVVAVSAAEYNGDASYYFPPRVSAIVEAGRIQVLGDVHVLDEFFNIK